MARPGGRCRARVASVNGRALHAVLQAAVDATAATSGWVLAARGDRAEVVAARGERAGEAMGVTVELGTGTAGFVIASGQPLALSPRTDDPRSGEGVAAALGRHPTGILCVACAAGGEVLGALELIDREGGSPFRIDDVEIVTVLADIAGAILAEDDAGVTVPVPSVLATDLARLATTDPARYAAVAVVVAGLLSDG